MQTTEPQVSCRAWRRPGRRGRPRCCPPPWSAPASPHDGHDLRGVAPDDGGPDGAHQVPGGGGAVGGGAGAHRVQHDGDAPLHGRLGGLVHGLDPFPAQGADVDHQGGGDAHHLGHLLFRVGHHRGSAQRQEGVGGIVHDHVIGDVVHHRGQLRGWPPRPPRCPVHRSRSWVNSSTGWPIQARPLHRPGRRGARSPLYLTFAREFQATFPDEWNRFKMDQPKMAVSVLPRSFTATQEQHHERPSRPEPQQGRQGPAEARRGLHPPGHHPVHRTERHPDAQFPLRGRGRPAEEAELRHQQQGPPGAGAGHGRAGGRLQPVPLRLRGLQRPATWCPGSAPPSSTPSPKCPPST